MHENHGHLHSQLEHNRLEFERRRYSCERLLALIESLEREGRVDPEVLMAYRVVATELALGYWHSSGWRRSERRQPPNESRGGHCLRAECG